MYDVELVTICWHSPSVSVLLPSPFFGFQWHCRHGDGIFEAWHGPSAHAHDILWDVNPLPASTVDCSTVYYHRIDYQQRTCPQPKYLIVLETTFRPLLYTNQSSRVPRHRPLHFMPVAFSILTLSFTPIILLRLHEQPRQLPKDLSNCPPSAFIRRYKRTTLSFNVPQMHRALSKNIC